MMLTHGTNNAKLNTPGAVTEIGGNWGAFLFFTEDDSAPYNFAHEYTIEVDEDLVASMDDIRWNVNYGDDEYADAGRAIVARYADIWGVDEDDALDFITERKSGWTHVDGWDSNEYVQCQRAAGEVAVALGFRGAFISDDTGRSVILNMIGRETELTLS